MLLEFSYANFLSFKNKVTFSMVATTLRDRKVKAEECTFLVGDEVKLSLCKAAAWLDREHLRSVQWLPADETIISEIETLI